MLLPAASLALEQAGAPWRASAVPLALAALVLGFLALRSIRGLAARIGASVLALWIALGCAAPLVSPFDPNAPSDAFRVAVMGGGVGDPALRRAQGKMQVIEAMGGVEAGVPPALALTEEEKAALARFDAQSKAWRVVHEGRTHWLSVDGQGRDILSRLIHGARASLAAAGVAAVVAALLARWPEPVARWLPPLAFLPLLIVAVHAAGLSWPVLAASLVPLLASRAAWAQRWGLGWREAALGGLAAGLLAVSAAHFIGFAPWAPTRPPGWGVSMADGRQLALAYPHVFAWPCAALVSCILAARVLR